MSPRFRRRIAFGIALFLTMLPGLAAGRQHERGEPTPSWAEGGLDSALVGVLVTVIVGGVLLVAARSYAERVTNRARAEPARSFGVGFVAFLAVLGLYVLGVATRILLILAVPLFLGYVVVAVLGTVVGELAAGRLVTNGWVAALAVAAAIAAIVSGVPLLGAIVGFVVGSIGVGAILNELRDGGSSRFDGGVTPTHNQR